MAEIERDGDDVLIRMKTIDLENLVYTLEAAGNSAARYRNSFPEGSLRRKFELDKANAAWLWANALGACPPNGSNTFETGHGL